jgi:hypothetical protein
MRNMQLRIVAVATAETAGGVIAVGSDIMVVMAVYFCVTKGGAPPTDLPYTTQTRRLNCRGPGAKPHR